MDHLILLKGRLLIALMGLGGLLIVALALLVNRHINGGVALLFNHVLTSWVIGVLVLWNIFAWALRRLWVGSFPKQTSFAAIVWVAFRVMLLVSIVILLLGSLISIAIGNKPFGEAMIQAFVMTLVFSVVTRIAGGAAMNSALVFKRWRNRKV